MDRHLFSVLQTYATYTHTNVGPTNTTVQRTGMIFTRYAVMTVFDGTNVIDMSLEITYDGQGTPHHRLLFPFPVDASIDYTSVTVRYFLNSPIAADGSNNSASSLNLRSFGINGLLTMPMSAADQVALLAAVAADDTVQAHFTDRAGVPRVFDVTATAIETDNETNFAYADYVRTNVTLMNYVYDLQNAAPADNSQITLVIGGGSLAENVPFAVGTDGIVNAPTQAEVDANRFLRADNTWQDLTAIATGLTISDGSDTWTWTADQTTRSLTLDLNGTNAIRWTRQADGTVDMTLTGNITANGTIT